MHSASHHEARRGARDRRRLSLALALTAAVMVLEVAGGLWANSLALLSDAGHMLTDVLSLGMALFAATVACRPATAYKTYGYHRVEILTALTNGVILLAVCLIIFYEAVERFIRPQPVDGDLLLLVAGIGLLTNLGGMALLSRAESIGARSARLHVAGDALSSAGVLAGGLVISWTAWYRIDSIVSFAIGLVVLVGAFRLLKETVDILLEATPRGMEPTDVTRAIEGMTGIKGVHDLHIWCITSGMPALSGHVILEDDWLARSDEALNRIKDMLRTRFEIQHTTIQFESETYTEVGEVH
ncbi:MAG TPA: cation diffusion facilitator family transporter [Candidatus Polarisedimenticolia bacterium]|nr:cation diffusion facilitator family transporter [Candidatus Polarisedimenticolia bacterium]